MMCESLTGLRQPRLYPSGTSPSRFTTDNLPVGLHFLGRPYSEPAMLKLAYAYEQSTRYRIPPKTTPALS
jgi:amidase